LNSLKIEDRDYALWLLFTRTHYKVQKARTCELRKFDLSPEQAGALFYIHARGNTAMPLEISRWMDREPQTITSIIDRMVKKDLVKKSRDSQRRNVVRLSLTEKGEQAYQSSIAREAFHHVLAPLSEDKRQVLEEVLKDMMKAAAGYAKNLLEREEVLDTLNASTRFE
jgi:DNA-binding MarR family transcriptional regulator